MEQINKDLNSRDLWKVKPQKDEIYRNEDGTLRQFPVGFSQGMKRVLDVLYQISTRPVYDPELNVTFAQLGQVCSEFIFAAILIEGTTVAADLLLSAANNDLTPLLTPEGLLRELNVKVADLLLHTSRDGFYSMRITAKSAVSGQVEFVAERNLTPWYPNKQRDLNLDFYKTLAETKDIPYISGCNWLVYPNLLIGQTPGRDPETLRSLLCYRGNIDETFIGRTTFVNLRGEFHNFEQFMQGSYATVLKRMLESERLGVPEVDLIWFGIEDFEITNEHNLVQLVSEVKRRLLRGERIYLHCRGGHGRTGMVAIPLVCALFKLDFEDAVNWVQETYRISERGQAWGWRLPETREQLELAQRISGQVKKLERGNPL